jgi:steroid 5-alpha reductase family enzyme
LGQLLISRVRANHSFGGEPRFLMALERFELGKHLWWVSLVVLVVFQSVFVTVLNLPLLMVLTSQVHGVAAIDVAGFVVVAAGAAIEILANHQLEVFRNDPANKSKGKTLNTGLWGWSRHPNYFGNVLCYWGFFLVAVHEPHLWYTAAGPLAIYGLLRFGSGVRLTEWMMLQKRQGDSVYLDYLARTSPFLLRPPRRPSAAATKIAGVEPQSATGSGASTPLH